MFSSPNTKRTGGATDISFSTDTALDEINDVVAQAISRGGLHLLVIYSKLMVSFDEGAAFTFRHIAFGGWAILGT